MQSFNTNDPSARASGPIGQKASDVIDEGGAVADKAAAAVGTAADYVRNNNAKSILADVQRLVKNNPGPALLAAVGVGFIVARILARD